MDVIFVPIYAGDTFRSSYIDICPYEIKFSLHMLDATSCELAFERNYDRDFMIDKRIDIYRCYVTYSLREGCSKIDESFKLSRNVIEASIGSVINGDVIQIRVFSVNIFSRVQLKK